MSEYAETLTWEEIETSAFCKRLVSGLGIFSGLVARKPSSAREAIHSLSNPIYSGLACPVDQLEEVCTVVGESARGKELHALHNVTDPEGIADAVADVYHFSSTSSFSSRILRLYVEDPGQVESVEACAREELAHQGERNVMLSIGFPVHRHVSRTMGKLTTDLCFLRLQAIKPEEIRNLYRFIKNLGPRGKQAVIERGERPALTRKLADGRLEVGWLNMEICEHLYGSRLESALMETEPEAFSFWLDRRDYGVAWNGQPAWVGVSEAYERSCQYDFDQVPDLKTELGRFSWTKAV